MSAILSADDLNDFISPGVACIKPIETLPDNPPNEVVLDGPQHQPPPAHISLTDCLACSGCVTSAEAVLVSLQSHAEVLATLEAAPALRVGHDGFLGGLDNDGARLLVASVSSQSRASLAAAAGVGIDEAGFMLEALLRGERGLPAGGRWNNGFAWVVDTDSVRDLGLVLAAREALSSTADGAPARPVLAASCPGWVCYAEKTHPHVLPHLSRVKSPQALMGTLLKTVLSRRLGIPPARIWHLAVMPCFDKKLEASREELTDGGWGVPPAGGALVRDVDCVITSKEVLMLCESRGIDFFRLPRDGSSIPPPPSFPDPEMRHFLFPPAGRSPFTRRPPRAAGSSGGLLHHILRVKAAQSPGAEIRTTRGRNADVVEYSVVSTDDEPLFRAARYYGFRNIQNLVRRLKPARPSRMPGGRPFGAAARRPAAGRPAPLEYGYVEVMACPGGCTNGGGQIKVDDAVIAERRGLVGKKAGPQEQKDWLAEVDEAYFSADGEAETETEGSGFMRDGMSAFVDEILAHWSEVTGIGLDRLAFTSYREVVSDVGKDQTSDADKVVQLAGKIGGGW
ncbi:hypothetical protein GQ602_000286 [Ophiocordyceps camponoti-floridani]|uniref:Cytosolic Fe-S cluster assembly factor NAR1 n=1 Tax=Ophiocordyceps camponoti-floridani TaxID=2030778 RepID=A0A8H4VG52_9HYPO|nr:hypothetical protein GQ602_000286 [Ophiocordyceps camponoti-floridani]